MLSDQAIQFFTVIRDWVETNSDLVTAAATAVIAIFTFSLWWATYKMMKVVRGQSEDMKDSIAATQRAAKAAQDSVDALVIAERAHIFAIVEPDREFNVWQIKLGNKAVFNFSALLYLHNLGKTPAIIKEIVYMGDMLQHPPTKDVLNKPHPPLISFIGSNERAHEDQFTFIIDESKLNAIRSITPKTTLYCFGYVKYRTIFNEDHCHWFCYEFSTAFRKFALSPNSELNYDQ